MFLNPRKMLFGIGLAVSVLLLPSVAFVAEAATVAMTQSGPPSTPSFDDLDELDEVKVRGTRVVDEIVLLEDRFFKLYNQLNKDNDFDINCTQIGTDPESQITSRACLPAFFVDAVSEQLRWSELCKPMSDEDLQGPPCYTPPAADFVLFARQEELARHVMTVIGSDARLLEMNNQRTQLEYELRALENRYYQVQLEKDEANGETREARIERLRCARPTLTRTGPARCPSG